MTSCPSDAALHVHVLSPSLPHSPRPPFALAVVQDPAPHRILHTCEGSLPEPRLGPHDLPPIFAVAISCPLSERRDKGSVKSKGVAYVEMGSLDAVPAAVGLNGSELMGQPINVKMAEAEKVSLGRAPRLITRPVWWCEANTRTKLFHAVYLSRLIRMPAPLHADAALSARTQD